eukprot:CAMPEP_0181319932 /NCGR_PEP_ID=MMETSP1101-20121128/17842_1 /TAXON_ID=46948 /ORGANISM="Rhodomonas abbreviata, Strain Caron Lab Isolate" /LENGTH=284 /DNA_ID=CAMNT_0023427579 /DNA_START=56 /DNA_END=910 /DNA_ORIENTATION=-
MCEEADSAGAWFSEETLRLTLQDQGANRRQHRARECCTEHSLDDGTKAPMIPAVNSDRYEVSQLEHGTNIIIPQRSFGTGDAHLCPPHEREQPQRAKARKLVHAPLHCTDRASAEQLLRRQPLSLSSSSAQPLTRAESFRHFLFGEVQRGVVRLYPDSSKDPIDSPIQIQGWDVLDVDAWWEHARSAFREHAETWQESAFFMMLRRLGMRAINKAEKRGDDFGLKRRDVDRHGYLFDRDLFEKYNSKKPVATKQKGSEHTRGSCAPPPLPVDAGAGAAARDGPS